MAGRADAWPAELKATRADGEEHASETKGKENGAVVSSWSVSNVQDGGDK